MCAVDIYGKKHVKFLAIQVVVVIDHLEISSSKEALISLGHNIKFIDNWIQCFDGNYDEMIVSYKENTRALFNTIPTLFQPKN